MGDADGYVSSAIKAGECTTRGATVLRLHFVEFTLHFTIKQYKNSRSANFVQLTNVGHAD